jgi:hypothetical protein
LDRQRVHAAEMTHNTISPAALAEGHLIGALFQIRDEYVVAHELVFGSPITRVLHFGLWKRPPVSRLASTLDNQLRGLDAALPRLAGLTMPPARLKEAEEYFHGLRKAIVALRTLLGVALRRGRLSHRSSVEAKIYLIAAAEFGRQTDRNRAQQVPNSDSARTPSLASVAGLSTSGLTKVPTQETRAALPKVEPQAPLDLQPSNERRQRQPIAISIDLAARLFDVATIGMRNFGRPFLEQAGVTDNTFRRLELEGLCLRLFTARTAFERENDQDEQHKSAVLDFFDKLVASHFYASPQHAHIYADRSKAYQLALAASDEFEEVLGREFSRLCRWDGEGAIAHGASQAIAMTVTAQEAVGDYASYQRWLAGDDGNAEPDRFKH